MTGGFFRLIRSMTGFARREASFPQGALVWELRALNHRYLDVALRLPEEFRAMESRVREMVSSAVRRGKLEATLRYQAGGTAASSFELDNELVTGLLALQQRIAAMMTNAAAVSPMEILKWPGVLARADADPAALHDAALGLLEDALGDLDAVRTREGGEMRTLLLQRTAEIRRQVAAVRSQMPAIIENQRARLLARLSELEARFDAARMEQEMLYLLQKADVEEELDRTLVHLDEVERVIGGDGAVGRRLDFLMQELNREANTLGSKSIDAVTSLASVEIKVAIEQMREQVQNIE
jgi:uncharacterized protein (TIGR00255 family)